MAIHNKEIQGFTLIELSIVLVIVGLIAGGVLVGKDLLSAAKLRNDLAKIDGYKTAIQTYRIKYGCIPGDCARATTFFTGVYDGNGNGVIDGLRSYKEFRMNNTGDNGVMEEISEVNNQLASANLISLVPFNRTSGANAYGGKGWLQLSCAECGMVAVAYNGTNYIRLGVNGVGGGFGIFNVNNNAYSPQAAFYIDSKIDDGLPISGSAQWWIEFNIQTGHFAGCMPPSGGGGAPYQNIYNFSMLSNNDVGNAPIPQGPCNLTIPGGF